MIEEQRRNETEEGDFGEILSEEVGRTGSNMTGEETNTTSVSKGIFARMNLDFLFGEGEEMTTEEEGDGQIEEEGIDDGSSCCPSPSNPCEVMSCIQKVFSASKSLLRSAFKVLSAPSNHCEMPRCF